jgi:hypothetical protein
MRIRGMFSMVIVCWGLIISSPSPVMAEGDIPEGLLDADCSVLYGVGLSLVADYFYADETDKALSLILYIEGECGSDEPLRRIQLLGAIWDGSFTEQLYGSEIVRDLKARYDNEFPDLSLAHFDSFTTDLADQLLPHVERQSVEEFFCVFYSGRMDEAYELLQADALQETNLAYYYRAELDRLDTDRFYGFGRVFGSYWQPSGNLARLGDHVMAGISLGGQYGQWFGRGNVGFRFARSQSPYYVNYNEESGWSDRTVGAKLTFDVGMYLLQDDRHEVGVFIGAGADILEPFNDVDEYAIHAMLGLVGVEYKWWIDEYHNWNISLGVAKEWYGSWDGSGTDLSGDAWDIRLGVGYTPGSGDDNEQRDFLGQW